MRFSTISVAFVLFLALALAARFGRAAAGPQKPLVVWLIPSEPATPDAGIGATTDCETELPQPGTLPGRIEEEIDQFNAAMAQTRVTVVNTQERFKAQLI